LADADADADADAGAAPRVLRVCVTRVGPRRHARRLRFKDLRRGARIALPRGDDRARLAIIGGARATE